MRAQAHDPQASAEALAEDAVPPGGEDGAAAAGASQRLTQRFAALTPTQRRLGDYVLAHRFEAATLAIDELARRAGVSVASANRFARALDYPAWAAFRRHWQAELQPQTPALAKLLRQQQRPHTDAAGQVRADLHTAAADLQRCARDLADAPLRELAERLRSARRIAVFGSDVSGYLGGYFASYLSLFRADVQNLAQGGGPGEPFRRLLDLGGEDLLLLLSLPRYSTLTLELADFAAKRGVPVAAITDSPGAPIASRARWLLLAPTTAAVLPTSAAATLALLEGLCAAVAARSPRRSGDLPALMEALAAHQVHEEPPRR